jgi:ABC-type nitrate/sulfonate/bicarbonate transport system substrate-binding protein
LPRANAMSGRSQDITIIYCVFFVKEYTKIKHKPEQFVTPRDSISTNVNATFGNVVATEEPMNGKKLGWLVLAIVLVIGVFALSSNDNNDKNKDSSTKTVTKMNVGHINLANDLPAFVAQEKGYFAEENLEVTLKKFDSSKLATDAIYSGDVDASAGSSTVPLLAAESVQPGKAKIYALGYTGSAEQTTLGAFVVLNESPIQSSADLAGKKIAVFPGGTAKILLTRYLKAQNVDVSGIQWIEQLPNLWVPSLQNGAVDAVFAYESTLTVFKQDTTKPVRVFGYGALESAVDPLYLGGSSIRTEFADKNPEAVKAYIRAYYKGIDFIKNNETEARSILAKYTGIKEEVAKAMNLYPDAKMNDIEKDKFQKLADILFEDQNITAAVDTSKLYIDPSFLQ